jgi:hypothetical protein
MILPRFVRVALISASFFLPITGFASDGALHSKFAGVYFSRGNDGGRDGSFMNLSLGKDGSATITEDPGTGNETTLFGHWVEDGSQVSVTIDSQTGEPTMTFASAREGLQAVTWNHATWGKQTPPPMKKGGFKVKNTYWLSENR